MERYELLGGRIRVYKRPRSRFWQCYAFVDGEQWRESTKEESPDRAKEFAENWYYDLRGKQRSGQLNRGKTFRVAAEQFMREFPVITHGQRNVDYIRRHEGRIRVYLNPFFGDKVVSEITPGLVQEYRIHRMQNSETGKPPARGTIHQEIVVIRQVLKTAQRHGWLAAVPDLSMPYKTSGKITHRAWFSQLEYRQLYEATRAGEEVEIDTLAMAK